MLVVRHGQTTWNALKRWQGRADSPLSALGVAEARWAAETLERFDVVVTSNLSRAHDTGTILAEAFGTPIVVDPDLAERDVGEWTGLTFDEIEDGWPGFLRDQHPKGWESDDDVATRDRCTPSGREGAPGRTSPRGDPRGLIRSIERTLGLSSPYLANLGGLWITVDDENELAAGDRVELIDHAAVAATVPDSE